MTKNIHAEQGQTMAEYAVVLGVITASLLLAFSDLSSAAANAIDAVVTYL
jgi:Flp pilus assembly pilin Flp